MEGRTQAPAPAGLAASHAVRIERVELLGRDSTQLVDCRLDRPEPGWMSEQFAVEIHGWAIPRQSPIERVEVLCYEDLLREATLDVTRPGVRSAFPDEPQALRKRSELTPGIFGKKGSCEASHEALNFG